MQFQYGEDGLDVTKVPFLKSLGTLHVLVQNNTRLIEPHTLALAKSIGQHDLVEQYRKKVRRTKGGKDLRREKYCVSIG